MADGKGTSGNAVAVRRTTGLTFNKPVDASLLPLPEAIEALIAEGFTTQRHVKLAEGDCIKGIYRGMEDGELNVQAIVDKSTGEVTMHTPRVKWVFLESSGIRVRMLGAYNMVSALENVKEGSEVFIGRASDYDLPNGYRCTDYWIAAKEYKPKEKEVSGVRVA